MAAPLATGGTTIPVHKWLVALSVLLGAILQGLDASIVNVALPYMQQSFTVGVDQISWVVTSYLVAIGIMIPMTGWNAVRMGRKRYFVASVLTFIGASTLCGLAQSLGQMVLFRTLQGMAGAAMGPLSQAILLETFAPEEHTLAMTTYGMALMAAPVLGPTVGGWITMHWHWRWIFFINLPIGLVGAAMVYRFVHDPPYLRMQRGAGRIDFIGIVLIAVGLGLFQLVLGRGGRVGWFAAPWVRYASLVSLVSLVAVVLHELRFPEPVLDLRLFRIFGFTLPIIIITLWCFEVYAVNLLNPLFMEDLLGYDAWKAGLAVAPRGIGVFVALATIGHLSRRGLDMRPYLSVGFVAAAYMTWCMAHWTLTVSMGSVLWPIFLFGFSLGAVFPTITAVAIGQVRRERMGFAASLFSLMTNLGAAIGLSVITNLLVMRHRSHLAQTLAAVTNWRNATTALDFGGSVVLAPTHHLLSAMVNNHAWLLAYGDIYKLLAVILLCLAPWCMLLNPTSSVGPAEVVME